jgi:Orsellinic acid/F9775 biosynthesis cluster protein D
LGTCIRSSPTQDLSCYASKCNFMHPSLDKLLEHVQKEHNSNNKISVDIVLFPATLNTSQTILDFQSSAQSTEFDDSANLASDEESTADLSNLIGFGPIRGRQPQLLVRPTPYQRTGESSSRSISPIQRSSFKPLSPLQISSIHALSAPSPLQQVAFSRPNSPSPPFSDNDMIVDGTESLQTQDDPFFNEEKVLAKASVVIISLSHIHTTPPTRLLACTKCQRGILASSLLSHLNTHDIRISSVDKRNLRTIMDSSSFLTDSIEVASPIPPCPPIEGIQVQDGFSCDLCNYCCITVGSMQKHIGNKHNDALGSVKANFKPAQVQSLFARRPKYFAVTPILRGLNKGDLFTCYMQQCAPEIEQLKILIPPLNANEVPPLLKVTQWHEHLKDYTKNREQVQKLLELIRLPTSRRGESWMGPPLRATIEGYMRDVRVKANNASLGIKCLLMECPRFVSFFILRFNTKELLEQSKMENTGFLLEMILSQSTARFSINGLMRFYSPSMAMILGTSYL